MKKYLILHGSFSSPFSNWIPWLRNEIESRKLEVYTPDMPSGVGFQTYNNWCKLMEAYVTAGIINKDTTIFAHSISPIFISKFLVNYQIKVKKLISVCGFNNYITGNKEYDEVNRTMYFDKLEEVKKYADEIICYYSDNDPYVKLDYEKEFANAITDKQFVIKNGGHLNSESGYTEFKELLKHI